MQKSFSLTKRLPILLAILALLTISALAQSAAPAKDADKKIKLSAEEVEKTTSEILEAVSSMRQLKVLHPIPSGVKSRAEIETMVIQKLDEDTKPEELVNAGKAMIVFGLAPKDFNYRETIIKLLTEQIAGFYDPKTKQFFMADWIDLATQKPAIAHELTHALQDQHFKLRRFENWPKGDSDREMAIHALIEGDASVLMMDYLLKPMNQSVAKLPMSITTLMEAGMAAGGGEEMKVLKSVPASLRESLLFPYATGAGFAQEMMRKQGWPGISQAFTNLPQSTEQILHIEKYLAAEKPVKVELPDLTAQLGNGWKKILTDINGEFGYQMLLAEYSSKKDAREPAAGWGGDQYAIYENSDGKLLAVHRSVWDTTADAEEFFNAYIARTAKRYNDNREAAKSTQRRFDTPDGTTLIELKEQTVVVIEGLPAEHDVRKVTAALWQAEQSVKPTKKAPTKTPLKRKRTK